MQHDISWARAKVKAFKLPSRVVVHSGIPSEYDHETDEIRISKHNYLPAANILLIGQDRLMSVAHEVGHAFLAHCRPRGFGSVFGNSRKSYDDAAWSKHRFMKRPPGFVRSYGTAHPDEDFCDCFAVILTGKRPWIGTDQALEEKLEFVKKAVEARLRRR